MNTLYSLALAFLLTNYTALASNVDEELCREEKLSLKPLAKSNSELKTLSEQELKKLYEEEIELRDRLRDVSKEFYMRNRDKLYKAVGDSPGKIRPYNTYLKRKIIPYSTCKEEYRYNNSLVDCMERIKALEKELAKFNIEDLTTKGQ